MTTAQELLMQGHEGTAGKGILVAWFRKLSLQLSVSNPTGATPSGFPINTSNLSNMAVTPGTSASVQSLSSLAPLNSYAFSLMRRVSTWRYMLTGRFW